LRISLNAAALSAAPSGLATLLSSCGSSSAAPTAAPPVTPEGPPPPVTIQNDPSDSYSFSFTDHPELAKVGGGIHVKVAATSGTKELYIIRMGDNEIETVSSICTHRGCGIDPFDPETREFHCPCHGSVFSADGSVVKGPATDPLPTYVNTLGADGVEVEIP
jgi:Rieske Fe-S protein